MTPTQVMSSFNRRLSRSNLSATCKANARQTLRDVFKRTLANEVAVDNLQRYPEALKIIDRLCTVCKISAEDIRQQGRQAHTRQIRQIAMYLLRDWFGSELPLATIGTHFGGRDHTTVMHSVQKVKDLLKIKDKTVIDIINRYNKVI